MLRLMTALVVVILLVGAQSIFADGPIESGIDATSNRVAAAADHGHGLLEADPDLTLHEVIIQTVEIEAGRLVVAARRAEADALKQNGRSVLSGAPTISANHGTDGLWSGDGYQQWEVGLNLPLWWPGQRRGRQKTARAAGAAASHAQRAHALEVAGWVRQSIADLAVSQVRVELTEAEWRAEVELANQIERAVALEELAHRELLLARSASLDRRLLYMEALEEAHHAAGTYFLLTGLNRWPTAWSEMPADSAALENHPLLLLATEEITRAEGELDRVSADQWGHPVLALGTERERDNSAAGFDDRLIAGLTIPLGRARDAHAGVSSARRALAEKRRDRQRLERKLRGNLIEAEHRFGLSRERVATASEQATMAAEYLRLTDLGFGLGETDLGQLLRARSRATAAEQTQREALILRQSSAGEMNQALGVVP
ncbi:MAG: TolC family protein [Myxococcales bacterium]|nr:hypothetical protein [Myxococcales bacterium]